jgi:hypothetical protein
MKLAAAGPSWSGLGVVGGVEDGVVGGAVGVVVGGGGTGGGDARGDAGEALVEIDTGPEDGAFSSPSVVAPASTSTTTPGGSHEMSRFTNRKCTTAVLGGGLGLGSDDRADDPAGT